MEERLIESELQQRRERMQFQQNGMLIIFIIIMYLLM